MKNSWSPLPKGADRVSQDMKPPTRLVVHGVAGGSPLFHAVTSQFAGRLRTFHVKQQQNYALSELPIHRGQIVWHDGRAKYTNIQGQELLELEVPAEVLKELEQVLELEQQQPEAPWDWLLIRLSTMMPSFFHPPDDRGHSGYDFVAPFWEAVLRGPKLPNLLELVPAGDSDYLGYAGYASEFFAPAHSGEDPPILAWGGASKTVLDGNPIAPLTSNYRVDFGSPLANSRPLPETLRVDLRSIPAAEIVIDIYGFLPPFNSIWAGTYDDHGNAVFVDAPLSATSYGIDAVAIRGKPDWAFAIYGPEDEFNYSTSVPTSNDWVIANEFPRDPPYVPVAKNLHIETDNFVSPELPLALKRGTLTFTQKGARFSFAPA